MDQSLTVRIKGDASGATSSGSELIDILNSISASVAKMAEVSVAGHGVAEKAAKKHAEAEGILGATIGKVETATNSAARAFSALGIKTGEASERILAVTEALEAVGKASAPLVLLGVAALGVASAFNFVKESIGDAAKMQSEIQALGVAVQDQRENWSEAREGVENWAESLEKATTFSKSEAISALDQLVTAGVHVADAQKIVTVATDVAAGSHRSLSEVVASLKEAEAGRGMGLVQLDGNLKTVIQSHGHLSEVLAVLSRDFNGQASDAANTYEGRQKLLKNTIEGISTEIGFKLIPYMDGATTAAIGLADSFEENFDRISKSVKSVVDELHNLATAMSFDLNPVHVIQSGIQSIQDPKAAQQQVRDAYAKTNAFDNLFDSVLPGSRSFMDSAIFGNSNTQTNDSAPDGSGNWWMKIQSETQAKIKADQDNFNKASKSRGTNLDNDGTVGMQRGNGGLGATPDESADKTASQEEKKIAVQETLKRQLEDLRASEFSYSDAVAKATTSTQKQQAEMALHAKVAKDSADAIKDIDTANKALHSELDNLTPTLRAQEETYHRALQAQHSFVDSLHGGKASTKEEQEALHAVNAELSRAWNAYNTTNQSVRALNQELDSNTSKLDANRAKVNSAIEAQNALKIAYDDAIAKNKEKNAEELATHGLSLEQDRAYWDRQLAIFNAGQTALIKGTKEYLDEKQRLQVQASADETKITLRDEDESKRRQLQEQELQDAEATYNMSLQQQIRYYEQRYAQQITADGEYSDESKKLWDEIIKLDGESFKQLSDAHKQLISEITKEETSFLDQVITKHKSFRDDLKTIWSDIEKNWEQSVEKMILDPNNGPLKDINQGIFNALSPSGGGGHGPTGAEGSPFYVRIDGASGKGAVDVTSDASQYGLLGIHLGASAASAAISALPSNSGLLGFLAGNTYATSGGADMANASFGDWGSSGSRAQSLFGTAAKDFGIGQVATSALEPNANPTDSSIGDLLGTGAALLSKANPLAGAALAIGGSLLGGLIGPHETAQQTPDISQSGYQQIIANLTGQTQDSNGNLTFANSQYDTTIGNQSQSQDLSSWLNDPSNVASLPAGAQQAYKDLIADQGTDTNDGIDPIASSIHQGMITLASGQTVSVDQYESDINTIQQLAGNTSTTPVFSLSRTYPTFSSTLGPQIGTAYNDPNQSQAVANGQGVAPAAGGSLRTTQSATTPLISISFDGANLVGSMLIRLVDN